MDDRIAGDVARVLEFVLAPALRNRQLAANPARSAGGDGPGPDPAARGVVSLASPALRAAVATTARYVHRQCAAKAVLFPDVVNDSFFCVMAALAHEQPAVFDALIRRVRLLPTPRATASAAAATSAGAAMANAGHRLAPDVGYLLAVHAKNGNLEQFVLRVTNARALPQPSQPPSRGAHGLDYAVGDERGCTEEPEAVQLLAERRQHELALFEGVAGAAGSQQPRQRTVAHVPARRGHEGPVNPTPRSPGASRASLPITPGRLPAPTPTSPAHDVHLPQTISPSDEAVITSTSPFGTSPTPSVSPRSPGPASFPTPEQLGLAAASSGERDHTPRSIGGASAEEEFIKVAVELEGVAGPAHFLKLRLPLPQDVNVAVDAILAKLRADRRCASVAPTLASHDFFVWDARSAHFTKRLVTSAQIQHRTRLRLERRQQEQREEEIHAAAAPRVGAGGSDVDAQWASMHPDDHDALRMPKTSAATAVPPPPALPAKIAHVVAPNSKLLIPPPLPPPPPPACQRAPSAGASPPSGARSPSQVRRVLLLDDESDVDDRRAGAFVAQQAAGDSAPAAAAAAAAAAATAAPFQNVVRAAAAVEKHDSKGGAITDGATASLLQAEKSTSTPARSIAAAGASAGSARYAAAFTAPMSAPPRRATKQAAPLLSKATKRAHAGDRPAGTSEPRPPPETPREARVAAPERISADDAETLFDVLFPPSARAKRHRGDDDDDAVGDYGIARASSRGGARGCGRGAAGDSSELFGSGWTISSALRKLRAAIAEGPRHPLFAMRWEGHPCVPPPSSSYAPHIARPFTSADWRLRRGPGGAAVSASDAEALLTRVRCWFCGRRAPPGNGPELVAVEGAPPQPFAEGVVAAVVAVSQPQPNDFPTVGDARRRSPGAMVGSGVALPAAQCSQEEGREGSPETGAEYQRTDGDTGEAEAEEPPRELSAPWWPADCGLYQCVRCERLMHLRCTRFPLRDPRAPFECPRCAFRALRAAQADADARDAAVRVACDTTTVPDGASAAALQASTTGAASATPSTLAHLFSLAPADVAVASASAGELPRATTASFTVLDDEPDDRV